MALCPRCKLPMYDWRNPGSVPSPTCDAHSGHGVSITRCRDRELAATKEQLSAANALSATLEREVTAWRALAALSREKYEVTFPGRRTRGDFGCSVYERYVTVRDELTGEWGTPYIYGEGDTPQAAVIDLAEKLGLLAAYDRTRAELPEEGG